MLPVAVQGGWGLPGWWCGDGLAQKRMFVPHFDSIGAAVACSMSRYHSPYKVMNTRTLKIESAGDFFYGKVSPKIRLSGRWLERAGFKPGHRVEVGISQPGILTLRFLASGDGDDNNNSLSQRSTSLAILGDLL
jgi:hypothetical protein